MDFSGIDFAGVGKAILDAAKVGIPVAITILGTKKGINYVLGLIKRA